MEKKFEAMIIVVVGLAAFALLLAIMFGGGR